MRADDLAIAKEAVDSAGLGFALGRSHRTALIRSVAKAIRKARRDERQRCADWLNAAGERLAGENPLAGYAVQSVAVVMPYGQGLHDDGCPPDDQRTALDMPARPQVTGRIIRVTRDELMGDA
jgi:hypothetical protein